MFVSELAQPPIEGVNFEKIEAGIGQIIGQNFKFIRQMMKLNQSCVADALQISLSQYRNYEAGAAIPPLDIACRWSLFTGAPIYVLLNGSAYQDHIPSYETSHYLAPFFYLTARLKDGPFDHFWQLFVQMTCDNELHAPVCPVHIDHLSYQQIYQQLGESFYQTIAQNLNAARSQLGLSQERVSELIGISDRTYRDYELPHEIGRFSMLIAARVYYVFKVNPMLLSQGSLFGIYRQRQVCRLKGFSKLVAGLTEQQYQVLVEISERYSLLARQRPNIILS